MRSIIWPALVLAISGLGSAAHADDDDSERRGRAERHCRQKAEDRGYHVEKIGDVDKVGHKRYDVKLHVDPHHKGKKDDDFTLLCRYDDDSRHADID